MFGFAGGAGARAEARGAPVPVVASLFASRFEPCFCGSRAAIVGVPQTLT